MSRRIWRRDRAGRPCARGRREPVSLRPGVPPIGRRDALRLCARPAGGARQAPVAETAEPVSEVAWACGFNSPTQFSTIFKRRTGVSPRRFRQDW
jgi:AraC-like DNA-binding protein